MPTLGPDHSPARLGLLACGLFVVSSPFACLRENPAFDPDRFAVETGDGDGDGDDKPGDGDGAPGDGDGDGAPGDGDGDGAPGDGDGAPGDGDGAPGDGDGAPGDGDGAPGDGDGDGNVCIVPLPVEPYLPFVTESIAGIETSGAPNFHLAPENCHLLMICGAGQPTCDAVSPYLVKVYSSGFVHIGTPLPVAGPLQMRFHPGGGVCDGATLNLDSSQFIELKVWQGGFEPLPIRLPCLQEYNVALYIAQDGSTFWNPGLTDAAALWD